MKESMSLIGYANLVRRLRRCQEEFFRMMLYPAEERDQRLLGLIDARLVYEKAVDRATCEILGADDEPCDVVQGDWDPFPGISPGRRDEIIDEVVRELDGYTPTDDY